MLVFGGIFPILALALAGYIVARSGEDTLCNRSPHLWSQLLTGASG